MAITYGTSGSDRISGGSENDEIYGYTPVGEKIASDLYRPVFATAPVGDTGRLFVGSQGGVVKIYDLSDPQADPETFLDLGGLVNNNTEAGLLGFAFHPQFAQNGKCYVNYTTPDRPDGSGRDQIVVEYTFDPNDLSAAPTSKTIMTIDYPQDHTHHRAGWLDFGPDGMLYIATGEDTVAANAQIVINGDGSTNHKGKILRIDVNSDDFPGNDGRNYGIPADNPTQFDRIDEAQPRTEIWALGLRNPWRCSFGPDGKLYIADVGQNTYEEINIGAAGGNYGWRDGPGVYDGPQNTEGYTDPIHHYGRDIGGSITGGYFYEGPGELNGRYIFGDFNNGKIFALDVSGTVSATDITSRFKDSNGNTIQFGHLSSFGRDGQGNIYAVSYADDTWGNDTGTIYRLNFEADDLGDSLDGGAGDDMLYGGAGDDTLYGGADNDRLNGGADNDMLGGDAGADTLSGGSGNDTYLVDGFDTVVEAAGQGTDTVRASANFALNAGAAIEVLETNDRASTAAIDLAGNAFAQRITGNAGANILDGLGGADTLEGLDGNDTYIVDGGDTVTEGLDAGIDTVEASLNYILGDNIENLTLRGAAGSGTGNALANVILGNGAANTLDGSAGSDTLQGGAGNDTYVVDDVNDVIVESAFEGTDVVVANVSFTLAPDVDAEILKAAMGDATIDLTGNAGANTLVGNSGANRFDGGAGEDTLLLTGSRADYTVARNTDGSLTIRDTQHGRDGIDTVLNVEIFQFSDRKISAASLLNSAPSGLALNGDVVSENSASGTFVGSFAVMDDAGDTHSFELVGNADGRFALDSKTGALSVANGVMLDYEQARQHTISVAAIDSLGQRIIKDFAIGVQDVRDERATGSALSDRLVGGSGKDVFSGAAGNDFLAGGLGRDVLTGGTGRDTFAFGPRDSGTAKNAADYITDFSGRSGDRIDLSAIDANSKARGNQAFKFIGKADFTKAGQLKYKVVGKETFVYLNTDTDKTAEMMIRLKGKLDLQKSWFIL